MTAKKTLRSRRDRLDQIDDGIVKLMAERLDLAREVARTKKRGSVRLRDRQREAELLSRLEDRARAAGLPSDAVVKVFQEILNLSFHEQVHEVSGKARARKAVHIGYQGVPGAYSQWAAERIAAVRRWSCDTTGFRTFEAVAEAAVDGRVDLGMLPVENTLAGSINETYDLLQKHSLYIVGEEVLPIEHCLAAIGKVPLHQIKRIYSHPQALAQCSAFLSEWPGAEVHSFFDTAAAMQKVAADQDPAAAAIAGDHAAKQYGLTVLKRRIANNPENYTRFLLVSRKREKLTAGVSAKTSLVLSVKHTEGALLEALRVIHDFQINMTKLESRPKTGSPWQYFFYIDFEGNERDANVAAMLKALKKATRSLRVLGSYVSRTVSEGRPVSGDEIKAQKRKPASRRRS
jgi:chorismate mutase/prephenate dehydratase